MTVTFKTPPADNFTQVPNAWLRDPNLTMKAKAILAYLISHEPGYDLTMRQMVAQMNDGEDAIYSALKELEDVGYLKRSRRREKGRIVGVDWEILAVPDQQATTPGFSRRGKASSGKASSGGSGTKNTIPENTTDQEPQKIEKTTSLSTGDDYNPWSDAPKQKVPNQRRESAATSKDQKFKSSKHRLLAKYGWNESNANYLIAQIEERYEPYSDGWWFAADSNGSLVDRIQEVLDDYNDTNGTDYTATMFATA